MAASTLRTRAMTPMMIPKTRPRATIVRGRTTRSWTASTTSSIVSATLAGHSAWSAGDVGTPGAVFVARSSIGGRLVGRPVTAARRAPSVRFRDERHFDRGGPGVGPDNGPEISGHQLVLGLCAPDHLQDVVEVGGDTAGRREAFEWSGLDGLVGQVLQRARSGALLGLDLHHAVAHLDHRLDRKECA